MGVLCVTRIFSVMFKGCVRYIFASSFYTKLHGDAMKFENIKY